MWPETYHIYLGFLSCPPELFEALCRQTPCDARHQGRARSLAGTAPPGALDFAILLAVSPGPKYGLAIIQYLEEFTDLVVTEGTIYPILGRLTRDGFLHAWWVDDEASHPRKYYRLTRAGSSRLRVMKSEWTTFTDKISRLLDAAEGVRGAAQ